MTYIHNMNDSWTDAATAYTAIKMDVTDTASASGSKLLDLLVGGSSKFSVSKTGDALVNGITVGRGPGNITNNVAYGIGALSAPAVGNYNVAVGDSTLLSLTTGGTNTAVGAWSLKYAASGAYNTAVGGNALQNVTTGYDSVGVGHYAGAFLTTAIGAVAVGKQALYSATTNTGTAVGYQALYNATGPGNFGAGYQAGLTITSGQDNTIIGHLADVAVATDNNSIVIGKSAIGNGSNTATWGNTSITDHYFSGTLHFGTFTTNADAPVNGYITIVDASGVTRKLATIA